MLENGFIKIFRSMLNWEWYDDANTTRVFLHLILTANWEDNEWHGITIKRGQRVCSYEVLAKELKLSIKNIRTAIKHLIRSGVLAHTSTPQYGTFTIVNYDKYQGGAPQMVGNWHSNGTQTAGEGHLFNKEKNDKKYIVSKDTTAETNADNDKNPDAIKEIIILYNQHRRCMIEAKIQTKQRQRVISTRIRQYGIESVRQVILNAEKSNYLNGGGDNAWTADLNWIMRQENFVNIIEGKYNNRTISSDQNRFKGLTK